MSAEYEKMEYLGRVISIDALANCVTTNLGNKAVLSYEAPAIGQEIFRKGWTFYVGTEEDMEAFPEIRERKELLEELSNLGRAVEETASIDEIRAEIKMASTDKLTKKERLIKQAQDMGVEVLETDSVKDIQEKISKKVISLRESDDKGNENA